MIYVQNIKKDSHNNQPTCCFDGPSQYWPDDGNIHRPLSWKWNHLCAYLMEMASTTYISDGNNITCLPTWLEWNHLLAELMEMASSAFQAHKGGIKGVPGWWKWHYLPVDLMETASTTCKSDGNGIPCLPTWWKWPLPVPAIGSHCAAPSLPFTATWKDPTTCSTTGPPAGCSAM